MSLNYTKDEKLALDFFEKYEFPKSVIQLLFKYFEKCRICKNNPNPINESEVQIAFMPLNTQLKQWLVAGAYSEDTYWEGVQLVKEVFYD